MSLPARLCQWLLPGLAVNAACLEAQLVQDERPISRH